MNELAEGGPKVPGVTSEERAAAGAAGEPAGGEAVAGEPPLPGARPQRTGPAAGRKRKDGPAQRALPVRNQGVRQGIQQSAARATLGGGQAHQGQAAVPESHLAQRQVIFSNPHILLSHLSIP